MKAHVVKGEVLLLFFLLAAHFREAVPGTAVLVRDITAERLG
jgi:hypothetical protein